MPGCKNFPMRNQLRDVPSADGHPPENANYDCVPESIVACIQYWTGNVVAADDLKDAAYGQGYVGGGSALVYDTKVVNGQQIDRRYGVEINYFEGDRAALIAEIKRNLNMGIPVLITMPSAWNTRYAPKDNVDHPDFSTHVGVAYWYDANNLYVMNPWGGFAQKQSFDWWQARLCFRSVWPVVSVRQLEVEKLPLPAGWTDDGKALHNPVNSFIVTTAKRQFILDSGSWDPSDVPVQDAENVDDVEEANPGLGKGNAQTFRMSRLIWDNKEGRVRRQWLGLEYLEIRRQRDALRQQLAVAQGQIAQLQAQLAQAQQGQPSQPAPADEDAETAKELL